MPPSAVSIGQIREHGIPLSLQSVSTEQRLFTYQLLGSGQPAHPRAEEKITTSGFDEFPR